MWNPASDIFAVHQHGFTKLGAVLWAVIHGYQSDRIFPCFISLVQHSHKNCHYSRCLIRAVPLSPIIKFIREVPCTAEPLSICASILTALYVTAETMAVWKPTALPTLWNSLPRCLWGSFSLCSAKKIPPACWAPGRLSEPSGLCHEKSEPVKKACHTQPDGYNLIRSVLKYDMLFYFTYYFFSSFSSCPIFDTNRSKATLFLPLLITISAFARVGSTYR